MNEKNEILAQLKPLIDRARKENKWLFCHYQQMWFSPSELEEQNKKGKFLWGEVNWKLRDPKEHITEMQQQKDAIQTKIDNFKKRINNG